ncbi:response regulator [Nostoc flagelliforme FACHB-838]|uniref:Response regulator n=1 Tax=Nostoc flagelliforme FACHB-838 TaxID=2692904 RepID=A0ABR8DLI6_9NOSO|nr:response regulator [Nostoc flagelliforme]MBD2530119.1 response regulator [Nostoc flagelliforme FACHB-838]
MIKILVIEDEPESRDIFLDSLEAEGFEAIAAENGLVGIQQAQEHLPDLVLCDIMMPELDGYGVLHTLRQNPLTATIPFIFLSAKSTKTEVRQGMNLGADDYLTKPSTVEELLEAIATRLEKQATMRQCYVAQFQPVPEPQSTDADTSANSQSLLPTCPQLKDVFDFIEANYHQSITLCDVAQAVGYSAAYLTDLVRRQTGKPVNHWIVERRMAAVRTLLLETDQSVNQIAEAVGYQNEGHFYRQFRQYHGTTPQVWRKAQRI